MTSIALVLTLAYAMPFGSLNQATYLLDPLHRAFPELFARDWFVTETPTYMPVFGWLAQWLFVIDHDGAIAVVTAHVVVTLATYAAISSLVTALHASWRAFAIVAAFVTLTRGFSMGGSYLLVGYLQPSSLATLGWIVALAAFARDRYLVCGIVTGVAGALHANFLVLGVGLFALAGLACRGANVRELAKLLGPQLAVLACFVPQLADAAGPSEHALWILSEVHAPVHYAPHRLLAWIPGVLCWQLAAYGAMFVVGELRPARVLWRFSLVASALACTSALLVQLAPLHFLVQLFTARVAPFAQLACLALVAAALVRRLTASAPLAPLQRAVFALGIVVPLLLDGWLLRLLVTPPMIAAGCVLLLVCALARRRVANGGVTVLAAAALGCTLWATTPGRGVTARPYGSAAELELERWARTQTEVDALFLIPPELGRFRLLARRAVVVDTKSPPLRPDLLEQWYRRLCAIVMVDPGPSARAIEALYDELTYAELERVARAFGADYIVAGADVAFPYAAVFRNADHAVYRVR